MKILALVMAVMWTAISVVGKSEISLLIASMWVIFSAYLIDKEDRR